MKIELVPAKLGHALIVVRKLREEADSLLVGKETHRDAMLYEFNRSNFVRAVLVDGHCVAIGGEAGPLLAPTGYLWAGVTNEFPQHYLPIARLVKREIARLLKSRDELHCILMPSDKAGVRFARWLGFRIEKKVSAEFHKPYYFCTLNPRKKAA